MPGRNLFEYAVIRVVPQVEREEFLNAGVIVFCKKENYLVAVYEMEEKRFCHCFPGADIKELQEHLKAFKNIASGEGAAGPIAALDAPSRFRWLTAKRSTMVQTSAVHPGMSANLDETVEKLFRQLVKS